jgi:anti-sigma factor RsiW
MTNDPLFRLRELSWRRSLNDAEKAELRALLEAHPEAQAEWEADSHLTEALCRLPDAPMPSNFTARVLQAVEREATGARRHFEPVSWLVRLRPWLPRAAFAAVALGAGLFSYHEVLRAHRARLVQSVATVSDVSSLPSPEILKDFDAIQAMPPTPPPDEALLALLQ